MLSVFLLNMLHFKQSEVLVGLSIINDSLDCYI